MTSYRDRRHRRPCVALSAAAAALLAVLATGPVVAAADGDWIDTWSASPQAVWGADFFAPVGIPRALRNQTIRQIARVSLGGSKVRVELSNDYAAGSRW